VRVPSALGSAADGVAASGADETTAGWDTGAAAGSGEAGRSSCVSTTAAAAIRATAIANSRGRSASRSGRFQNSRSRSTTTLLTG
jgi:hypothetical protein